MSFTGTILEPVKVDKLSNHSEYVRDDDNADWVSLNSDTIVSLRDDYIFEESGVATLGGGYEYSYQFATGVSVKKVRTMQEDVGWFGHEFEPDENSVDESSNGKYSLESRIEALARTVLRDGYGAGSSAEEVYIEYTNHDSLDRYIILMLW